MMINNFKKHLEERQESQNRIADILNAKKTSAPTPEPVKTYIPPNNPSPTIKQNRVEEDLPQKYRILLKAFFTGIGILVLIFVIATGGYKVFTQLDFGNSSYKTDTTLEDLGRLLALPTDEDPTIATITDPTPLKDQEFFKDAQVGDKVIIYSTSSKAILYRPSEKRVIVVAPINK